MKTELWIATRLLKGTKDQSDLQIEVAVGQPEIAAEGEWRCAFRVSYEGREHLQHGHGIDAIQALIQALEGIRVTLGTIGTPTGGAMSLRLLKVEGDSGTTVTRFGQLEQGSVAASC